MKKKLYDLEAFIFTFCRFSLFRILQGKICITLRSLSSSLVGSLCSEYYKKKSCITSRPLSASFVGSLCSEYYKKKSCITSRPLSASFVGSLC